MRTGNRLIGGTLKTRAQLGKGGSPSLAGRAGHENPFRGVITMDGSVGGLSTAKPPKLTAAPSGLERRPLHSTQREGDRTHTESPPAGSRTAFSTAGASQCPRCDVHPIERIRGGLGADQPDQCDDGYRTGSFPSVPLIKRFALALHSNTPHTFAAIQSCPGHPPPQDGSSSCARNAGKVNHRETLSWDR
jgi:hypothetical protein